MAQLRLGKTQTKTAQAIVNVFETGRVQGDYGQVTLLQGDTGHLTYGRAQTTLSSGNLALLIRAYCIAPGAQFAGDLLPFLSALDAADISLDNNTELHDILWRASADPVMRTEQDAFFDRVYWNPALQSSEALALTQALSVAVVYDSQIHGSFRRVRDKVIAAVGQPSAAGEKTWVARYVSMRRDFLATNANALLHKTVYRMDTFQKLIGQKKWNLQLPLTAHGVVISQAALGASDDEPVVISADDAAERVLRLTIPVMQGTDVKKVQRALGFSGDAVDGFFGPDTDMAVRTFQQNHGLFVDGKVGNATRTALGL